MWMPWASDVVQMKLSPGPRPDAVPVFAALGDATRLELVLRMSDLQPHSIARLTQGLTQTRQSISKHLSVLERAGLVVSQREGRENRYSLEPAGLEPAKQFLQRASAQWDDAILRLKAFVEEY